MRTTWALTASAVAALALPACSGDDGDCAAPTSPGPGTVAWSDTRVLACVDPELDRHNDADETYVQVAHSQLGWITSLARLVDSRSDHGDVVALAEEVLEGLEDPIDHLLRLEEEWDLPQVVYDLAPVAYSAVALPQMEPDPIWEALRQAEGEEFDALWVPTILENLESAASSADTVIAKGRNRDLRATAELVAELVDGWIEALEATGEDPPAVVP